MLSAMNLPFPPRWKSKSYTLPDRLCLEQWLIPAGTEVKLFTTDNWGLVVLPPGTCDAQGHIIPKRLFRW
jgi:hypothetical protein